MRVIKAARERAESREPGEGNREILNSNKRGPKLKLLLRNSKRDIFYYF